ncbi:MAG TPA: type II toxin-antitoxin system RelE/ParE family toxin [Pseudolabrys sp.]|nr:type II toxin-antitoxin system RelE/ParE family toxin [Pseudolabrys sp.]
MHTVVETSTYLRDARRVGLSDDETAEIAKLIAASPSAGDLIKGTGGARKVRMAGRGKGKSGGYRVISFYAAEDVPVFLLAIVSKGERTDLSQAERNALRKELAALADDYRAGVQEKVESSQR